MIIIIRFPPGLYQGYIITVTLPFQKCHQCGQEQAIAKKKCDCCGNLFEKKRKNVEFFKTMNKKNVTRQREKMLYRVGTHFPILAF